MPLDKLLSFTKDVQDLADKPSGTMTSAQLKAQFDAAPNELRLAFNQLIDDISSVVDGDSGADNIAVTAIAGLTGATVQAVLESLKALDDENRAYLLEQIQGVVLGSVPDGTITDAKLSNDPTGIKQRFTTHLADDTRHVTSEIAKFKKGSTTYTDNDTSQTFTDVFCTANSLVTVTITSATPPLGVWTVNSEVGSFTIASTVAESADITFDYYIQKAVG